VKDGRFREDLYYRLNVVSLTLPPLRERREDIPLLARHFVAVYAAETKKPVRGITAEAMDLLMGHPWPGNVREMANAIERAVVLCGGPEIGSEDLALTAPAARSGAAPLAPAAERDFFAQVETFKQNVIKAALVETGGNQTRAAELLGLQRTHLVKLLRALKIREPKDQVEAGG
jgi:two-component system response regulator HydG